MEALYEYLTCLDRQGFCPLSEYLDPGRVYVNQDMQFFSPDLTRKSATHKPIRSDLFLVGRDTLVEACARLSGQATAIWVWETILCWIHTRQSPDDPYDTWYCREPDDTVYNKFWSSIDRYNIRTISVVSEKEPAYVPGVNRKSRTRGKCGGADKKKLLVERRSLTTVHIPCRGEQGMTIEYCYSQGTSPLSETMERTLYVTDSVAGVLGALGAHQRHHDVSK